MLKFFTKLNFENNVCKSSLDLTIDIFIKFYLYLT